MGEKDIGIGHPENSEIEPTFQVLKKFANELGFHETIELQEIERQAIESSKSDDSHTRERFPVLIAEIQRIGEEIVNQRDNATFGLAQVGLMVIRAATLFESNHFEECRDEVYDILTALDNIVAYQPSVGPIISRIEEIRKALDKNMESKNEI